MKRRVFLGSVFTVSTLAGCLGDDDSDPALKTELDAGSPILTVSVAEDAPGPIEVTALCRDEARTVETGEEFTLRRQKDGESCTVRVRGEYRDPPETEYRIGQASDGQLTVTPDGAFEFDRAVIN
jgi:hypothetical protein